MDLCQRYLNARQTIITDHVYTLVPLIYELLKNYNTHLVGALQSNIIKLPQLTKTKLKPSEIVERENGNETSQLNGGVRGNHNIIHVT